MTPTRDHAKSLTSRVFDQIERDRGINRENLTTEIFAGLLLIDAEEPKAEAPAASDADVKAIADAGEKLWNAMTNKVVVARLDTEIQLAWQAMLDALNKAGKI